MQSHHIHPELLGQKVRVLVIGCGGNGSAIAAGLPYLHQALLASGHPEGIHVTLLDPDISSPTNCVRQPFSRSEIGLYKSVVLANRLNLFWGLDWEGIPERFDVKRKTYKAKPKITSFSPSSGPVGTLVMINGTGLIQTSAVKFGTVKATTLTMKSDSQVTAIVPSGLGAGAVTISIVTPGGTANSPTKFTVN